MAYDLLIKNGRVVDGSGEPAFDADVAVQDGKIVGVGKSNGAAAKRTIDATGRVVAPGFIDHHTHFDPQAVWDPYCGSWLHNGHTTVIVGQCGQVIAPVRPGDGEWYLEFFSDAEQIPLPVLKAGVDVTWESVGDYLNALGKKRGINVGTLVGHSGIRRYVMGEASGERVKATPEELAQMQKLVREAMYDGALGFSTAPKDRGDPAGVPDDAERWALASVLGELGTGVFQVAGGAPGGTKQTRAVARELAARTGRPSIYNLMSDPIGNPDEWVEHLKWLEDGFKSGARCYGSALSTVAGAIFNLERGLNVPQDEDITHPEGFFRGMPTWDKVMALPYQDRMRALRDPEIRRAMTAEAIDRNHDPQVQKHILGSQYTVIGTSDGGGRPHTADRHETSTNLLGHWVREQQAMTLEEAVYRLTGKTALMHDITDRGFIAAGKVADITIFDPDTIASKPREPSATLPGGGIEVKREAVGIDYVVVNGTVLAEGGQLTDALPGQIIRGPLYSPHA